MGRQVSFYLTPEDTNSILEKIREVEDFYIIHSRSPSPRPYIVESTDVGEGGRPWLFYFLVQKNALESVLMKEVPAQKYWAIDDLRSPVIQLTRSFCRDGEIKVGRAWYETKYFDGNGEIIQKTASFVSWADKVVRTIKKKTSKHDVYYIGDQAKKLLEEGELRILDPYLRKS